MLPAALREAMRMDWSQSGARAALACTPAIAIALGVGLAAGHPGQGLIAASGAMSVGFGVFQRFSRSRAGPGLLASVGMAISAWVGSLVGNWGPATAVTAALWSFACGLLWEFNVGVWWVGLQCAIALLVAAARPAGPWDSAGRALLIFAGGTLQAAFVLLLNPRVPDRGAVPPFDRAALRLNFRSPSLTYAIRLALIIGVCVAFYRAYAIRQGYWLPMTVLIILKPDFQQTLTRGVARMLGTLAGAGVATLVAAALRPGLPVLAALAVLFAGLCYTLIYVNYTAYSVCITSYVVFLLAMAGLPERTAVEYRMAFTCAGGAVALLSHLRIRTWRRELGSEPTGHEAATPG